MRDALLAAGVTLSYASQLSVPGLPYGYGEVLLGLWIALAVGRILAGGPVEVTPALFPLVTFWAIFALVVSIGTFLGHLTTTLYLTGLLHDTMAYGLLACFTCLVALEPNAERHLRRTAWWIVAIASGTLSIQVAQGWGLVHLPGVDPWYWDRFCGWSENPNQLALYCAVFGPLALHMAVTTDNRWARLLAVLCMGLVFFVGRLTKSDTYLYTTILAVLGFLALRFRTWISSGDRATLGKQIAILLIAGAIPLAVAVAPYAASEETIAKNFAKSLTKGGGGAETAETLDLRLLLWGDALDMGLRSASIGLGPGPHLERPPVADRQFLPRPFEAHNTILDLYLQGGLIVVLAVIWIVVTAAYCAWRNRLDAMTVLLASVVIFSMPHMTVRHPIVWFVLTFCLMAGTLRTVSAGLRPLRAV